MNRPRVLVVDDKETILGLFQRILADSYEVTTAEDGARALALLASGDFDVVLTDIKMPGVDGFTILRETKRLVELTAVCAVRFGWLPADTRAQRAGDVRAALIVARQREASR